MIVGSFQFFPTLVTKNDGILLNKAQNSKLNLNLYHYKLKIISTSKQNYNSKFQEFEPSKYHND